MPKQNETLTLADLTPDQRNARRRTERSANRIARSLEKLGAARSIVIDEDGRVLCGNGTIEAAAQVGIEKVQVVETDGQTLIAVRRRGLSEAEKVELAVADNRTAELSEWDTDVLAELATEVDLGDWFRPEELDSLLEGLGEVEVLEPGGSGDEDAVPEPPPEPVTKPGDVWLLGKHRLMCGDSTMVDHVTKLLNGAKAEMVFTDPPYGVNVKGGKSVNGQQMRIAGDLTQTAIPFSFDLAVQMATTQDARFYFCGGEGNMGLYAKLFDRHLGMLPRHLIWIKNGFTMKPNGYHNQYEIIFHGYKPGGGGLNKWYGERTEDAASDVWRISRDAASSYVHPTQKPVALPLRAIQNSCKPSGIVYEPFCGSGSTLIACEQSGRICRAMEVDPKFCDVIVRRWQQFTGKQAVLESTGQPFPTEDVDA